MPIALLWALVGVILLVSLRQQQGHFCYGLDDAYIHMAMARHFAQAGVWGVTRYGFTSSASSLLWPLLIAGIFRLVGPNELTSLLLNLLLATLLLVLVFRLLRRQGVPAPWVAGALCLIIVAMPLPTMIFNGLEHCLQTLVAVLFVSSAALEIATPATTRAGHPIVLYLLAPLLTLVRFEGLFLAFAVCLLLLLRRRVLPALLIGAGVFLPVVLYAAISLGHGWWWLPNSVLLKGNKPHLTSLHGTRHVPHPLLQTPLPRTRRGECAGAGAGTLPDHPRPHAPMDGARGKSPCCCCCCCCCCMARPRATRSFFAMRPT